ncbi:MAG: class I SAM-dependent methyltransferase [archaeon]|nr:MAG: class I SAM-dependent methyltransferase [archaeon]
MPIADDPEGIELRNILKAVSLKGKDVLEVGCGEGRLTFRYFHKARRVVAIDSDLARIRAARRSQRKGEKHLEFKVGRAEALRFPDSSFDVVFFSWSLCCVDVPAIGRALDEAWRVLRPGGTLLNLQPSLYQPFGKGVVPYLIQGQFGTSVDDDRYRQSRLALKYASLIETKFSFISEEEFSIETRYDTSKEALNDLIADYKEDYRALGRAAKDRVKEAIESMRAKEGCCVKDNVVLTVLKKATIAQP